MQSELLHVERLNVCGLALWCKFMATADFQLLVIYKLVGVSPGSDIHIYRDVENVMIFLLDDLVLGGGCNFHFLVVVLGTERIISI